MKIITILGLEITTQGELFPNVVKAPTKIVENTITSV